jgi:hypothetical protein
MCSRSTLPAGSVLGRLPGILAGALAAGCLFTLLPVLAAASSAPALTRSERPIGPGVRVLQWTTDAPHALYSVEADLGQPFIRAGFSVARGESLGLEPLSRQAERLTRPERYPIAGVNGDYFFYPNAQQPGIPTNALIIDGELIRTPFPRSCLVLPEAGLPDIRLLRARGLLTLPGGATRPLDGVNQPRPKGQSVLYTPRFGPSTHTSADGIEVYLSPESFPLRQGASQKAVVTAVQRGSGNAPIAPGKWVLSASGAAADALAALAPHDRVVLRFDFDPAIGANDQVLGGGPRLVRDGRISVEQEGGSTGASFATTRYPRTAVGFNGRKLYLLVVDGRQPGFSQGMSLHEVAQVLVGLGCTEALNMDGGGSSTIWVRGAVLNRPSDAKERSVANGLFIFSTAPKGEPVRLVANQPQIDALAGAEVPLTVQAEDQYYNPVQLPTAQATWQVDPALGRVEDGRFIAAAAVAPTPGKEYAEGVLAVSAGSAAGRVPVRVYPRPARVEVRPGSARLGTGSQQAFQARAFASDGRPLALPASVSWQASAGLGTIDAMGTLLTAANPGLGTVSATLAGVSGSAQVEVREAAATALEDFEGGAEWKMRVSPAGTPAAVTAAGGTTHGGKKALRIEYDFTAGAGTRAVYAVAERPLGTPIALKVWVYGDGQGAWLRARVRDAAGTITTLDLARRVDWNGSWRELRAPISEDLPGPVTLESIYLVEADAARKPKGAILIDDLSIE